MNELLVLSWIALALSLISSCVSIYCLFKLATDSDVGELARNVAALRKGHRQEQMRRVREEAVADRAASAPIDPKTGQPFPFGPLVMPGQEHFPANSKQALRQRVFGARLTKGGNGGGTP